MISKNREYCVVMAGGLGYQVYIPENCLNSLPEIGEEVFLYTYLAVREDAMTLYGFTSPEQLAVFKMIINVSGIGPKIALASVSTIPPTQFYLSVLNDQVTSLTKIPGVGKKSAQRMILELKEKVKDLSTDMSLNTIQDTESVDNTLDTSGVNSTGKFDELSSALQGLGYTGKEIDKVSVELQREISQGKELEELLKMALQKLNSR